MIRFKSVSLQNFLSYGAVPTVVDLDPGGTTLIVGEDLDDTSAGVGANGVGKSVWLNALVYGLYGKPISNISVDRLVNNINNTHMEVIVEFQKDDKIYAVKRVRKEKGKSPYAKVSRRGLEDELDWDSKEQDVTPDSLKNISLYIEDVLGIPYELFVRIVAFSATHTPFLDLPVRHASAPNQSDIMEELFRLNRLSEKAELLKKSIKDTKQSLQIKQQHNEQLEKEHERHKTQLESAQRRVDEWEESRKIDIFEVKDSLKSFEELDIENQERLFKSISDIIVQHTEGKNKAAEVEQEAKMLEANIKTSRTELDMIKKQNEANKVKFDEWNAEQQNKIKEYEEAVENLVDEEELKIQGELHDELQDAQEELRTFKAQLEEKNFELSGVEKSLKDSQEELTHLKDAKCPYCLQKYENADEKILECEENIAGHLSHKGLLESAIKGLNEYIEKSSDTIKTVEGVIKYSVKEIEEERYIRENVFVKLEELKNEVNPYTYGLGEAEDETKRILELSAEIKKKEEKIDELNDELVGMNSALEEYESEVEKLEEEAKFPSLEDLYKAKANIESLKEKLDELEKRVNPHLESLEELKALELEAVDMDSVNELDKLLTHQNYLLKLLTKKDSFIRKNLLNKNLLFLNQRLKGYLRDMGLPHKVEFTQEMTAHISRFGHELDFGQLSSGQKARVNFALSFSFRDVLQRSLDSVNVCMLDEVLDLGLDSVGVQNAARMIKRKARDDNLSMYIISHRDEVSGIFDKKMVVQMSKGFSSIKEEL